MQLKHALSEAELKQNHEAYQPWSDWLYRERHMAKQGGSETAKARHKARGKKSVHERIQVLLDPNSFFMELSDLAGHHLYADIHLPSGGLVTGIGFVHARPCMIIANDPTVKGGTYFPITVKKHLRAQRIAMRHHLPCIYLVDSGGAFLPKQHELFADHDHFGRIFQQQAQMSAAGIPQFAVVMGACTAGGAYIPAMADEVIMVEKQSTIFLAGPPLVSAATGEVVSSETLGGSDVHCRVSGVADLSAPDEAYALSLMRGKIAHLQSSHTQKPLDVVPPNTAMHEIMGFIPNDSRHLPDMDGILSCLLDGSELMPFKPKFGTTLMCGFGKIMGHTIGILANNGILNSESAVKAAQFIQICCKRQTPLLFLHNINGFLVGKEAERSGIAKHGAKMVMAVANANIPKYTIIIGGSYGAGNYAMCGRAYDPDFLWQWPNAKTAIMGGQQVQHVMQTIGKEAQNTSYLDDHATHSTAFYGSARLWDDGIIHPTETRDILGFALGLSASICTQPTQFGIFRM